MWTSKGATTIVAATLCLGFLSGCDDVSRWQNRYGPDPRLVGLDVHEMVSRQRLVLASLQDAVEADPLARTRQDYWYQVAQAGFLYVDEKCDTYLTNMFKFERERDRIRGTLTIIDKGVGAILGLANNDRATIGIVAQAFGMAAGVTDVIGDSYLFKVAPGIVTATVDKLRQSYWRQAAENKAVINSPTAALSSIRGYLELCLPSYIEAKISDNVARAVATPMTPSAAPLALVAPATAGARSVRVLGVSPRTSSPRFGVELVSP